MEKYENRMQMYYLMQPGALRETAKQGDVLFRQVKDAFSPFRPEKVFLLGIGSSFHSARLAEAEFRAVTGLPVECITPEQAALFPAGITRNSLVIAVSQSGTSSNTLRALREIRSRGGFVCAVTQGLSSPIAHEADAVVPLCIPDEKAGPKTMGVIAAAGSLLLIAAGLTGKTEVLESLKGDFLAEADAMEENVYAARDWAVSLSSDLTGESAWMVVGQRAAFAPAGECALKLTETVRRVVACYELEEAVHGPCAAFLSRPALMLLQMPGEDTVRPEALCGACEARGGHAYRVRLSGEAPLAEGRSITLKYRSARLSLLELLLPAQAVSAWIPPRMGIDLDRNDSDAFSRILAGHLDQE